MIAKINFEIEAVSCLLAQGRFQLPLRTLVMRIANAARLLDGPNVKCHMSKINL